LVGFTGATAGTMAAGWSAACDDQRCIPCSTTRRAPGIREIFEQPVPLLGVPLSFLGR